MTHSRWISPPRLAALLVLAMPVAALAQEATQTGTGGGPTSTFYAPNTSSVGRVMPPGRGAGQGPQDADRTTAREKEADNIMRGICIGCGAK